MIVNIKSIFSLKIKNAFILFSNKDKQAAQIKQLEKVLSNVKEKNSVCIITGPSFSINFYMHRLTSKQLSFEAFDIQGLRF